MDGRFSYPAEQLAGALFSPLQRSLGLYGYIDGVHGRCVDGWVFDAASPDSTLGVEICDGAAQLGVAQARLFRADLDAIGIGSHKRSGLSRCHGIFDGGVMRICVPLENSALALPGGPRRLSTGPLNGNGAPLQVSEAAQFSYSEKAREIGATIALCHHRVVNNAE